MKKIYAIIILVLFISLNAQTQNNPDNGRALIHKELQFFNLSALNWLNAFDSLHTLMDERYPFTKWKAIEWDQKKTITQPKVEEAQNEADFVMFTGALLEYLLSIPDGHITMIDLTQAYVHSRQAGSFGLNMIPVTDGSIVVNIVPEWGPAYSAGLRCGDEIISWNGTPILEVPEMEVYNNPNGVSANYATKEGRLISRYEILSRDSVGAVIDLTFESHETGNQHNVTLTAVSDTFSLFYQAFQLTAPVQETTDKVVYKIMNEQVGYLHVADEDAPDSLTLEEIRQTEIYLKVKEAITHFNNHNIDKLIFDLRQNNGGNDLLGSAISGFFIESPMFYEYITGTSDENYEILDSIITVPEIPYFNGEVIAMVSPKDISTGEGIPMVLQRLPNARIVSFWGTNGSFAIIPYVVIMPDSLQFILFPYARSLDEDKVIQIDTDSSLVGGVQPDIKIPLTVDRVIEQWQEGKDVELNYALSILLDIPEIERITKYHIYPNPATTTFIVESGSNNPVNIRITDLSGRMIRKIEQYDEGVSIDIRELKSGLYFVSIYNDQEYQAEKLLIQ